MKQKDDKGYKTGKFLKGNKQYIEKNKNTWDNKCTMEKIPSILIYEGNKIDEVNYDINPKGTEDYNISLEQKEEIEKNIYELYKKNIGKNEKIKWHFGYSGNFEILSEKSEKIAEDIYDLLLKYIK